MTEAEFRARSARALRARDYRELVALCRTMRKQRSDFADAWFLESVAAEAGRNLSAAIRLVDEALRLAGDNAEYLVQKSRYHAAVNQLGAAGESAERALRLGVQDPLLLDTLGVVFTRRGEYEQAAALHQRAVDAAPGHAQFHFNLAAARQFLGEDGAAREHYERVIALQPSNARAYWALSELGKDANDDRHEAPMKALAEKTESDRDGLYLAHALARIDEGRGDYETALRRLVEAKARRRKALDYSFARDRTLFASIREHFASAQHCEPIQDPDADPISGPLFIVGLPRTGTTLVERILSSHSHVASLGEIQDLPIALKRLSGVAGREVLTPEVIGATAGVSDLPLAETYVESVRQRRGDLQQGARYLIDKTPMNALLLGFIFRCLPAARVILVRRDAMDAGLSNFRQLFALDYSYYNYSYDLADTGHYVAEFERLSEHWASLLGSRLFTLRYEDLVRDPEPQIRAMLAYLDLDWEASCLRFHDNRSAVATPSNVQVRRPLYTSAIGRWRRYGDLLEPMRAAIAGS
ncbi:MAG: sulfotransferase [Pseudomonadota bacterium]